MSVLPRILLAIESSCDETAVAIVEYGTKILANVVSSQIAKHRPYGGVVPELAARCHTEVINALIERALLDAKLGFIDLDAIAVTQGPGLIGALLVGQAAAKTLALALDIPFVAVNHLKAHVYSNFLEHQTCPSPPTPLPRERGEGVRGMLCLLVSGGHTQLIELRSHTDLTLLAETSDDAAGEAFDKVARLLGLGFPGGPALQACAEKGNPLAYKFALGKGSTFSFSGIKTGVAMHRKKFPDALVEDVAASFQKAVVDALVLKTMQAAEAGGHQHVMLCGGVAANKVLRQSLAEACASRKIAFSVPPFEFCTDNAAMIGCAGYFQLLHEGPSPLSTPADPNLVLV